VVYGWTILPVAGELCELGDNVGTGGNELVIGGNQIAHVIWARSKNNPYKIKKYIFHSYDFGFFIF